MLKLARAASVSTQEAIERFTIRRGSILKFSDGGACVALEGARCGVHRGRPLACRLYPLGIERIEEAGEEKFVTLEPAKGSLGVYGIDGTVNDFVDAQGIGEYLEATARYASLLAVFRGRIAATVDFDRVEPREFWRRAIREALAESNYDANPLIDAMFDAEGFDAGGVSGADHCGNRYGAYRAPDGDDSTRVECGAARGGGRHARSEPRVFAGRGDALKRRRLFAQFDTEGAALA